MEKQEKTEESCDSWACLCQDGKDSIILENRFQQFFFSLIVAPELFCQKEDSSSRMAGNQLERSTIPIANL